MSSANFARLSFDALRLNHIDAMASMVCNDPVVAARVFRKLIRNGYAQHDFSSMVMVKSIIQVCFNKDEMTADNLLRFVSDSSYMGDLYQSTRELNHFISRLEDLSGYEQIDLSDYGISMCPDCESWEYEDELAQTYHDESVCRSCISANYEWSSYYDQYVHNHSAREALDRQGREVTIHEDDTNFSWDEDRDCYIHDEYNPRPDVFGSYHESKRHQRPKPNAWSKRHNDIYFGIELEVECTDETYRKVEQLHPHLNGGDDVGTYCFFESDGSLNNGFEIITQPMGMDDHRSFWTWLQKRDLTSSLKSHNTSTCGLHIHISRDPLFELQINKMITFVNHPDNSKLILAIARRYDTGFARIKNKTIENAQYDADRYEAINIRTNDEKTLEFRIFKGTLKYESVMASLQFVNALAKFCASDSFDLTTPLFLEFIQKTEDTEMLVPYIRDRLIRQGVVMPEISSTPTTINSEEGQSCAS